MTNKTCPVCGKGQLLTVSGSYATEYLGRDGEPRPLQVEGITRQECDACGEAVIDDGELSKIEASRYRAQGLLSPTEIKSLRMRLRKTQAEMSRLLGVGKKTYCRWESGSYRQNCASDRYLRLLIAEPKNVYLLEQMEEGNASSEAPRPAAVEAAVFRQITVTDSLCDMAATFTELLGSGELHALDEVLV